jgi:hypothetical protein
MVARPPNGGRARRRGAQDGASGTFPLLALGRSSADDLGRSLAAARKREQRERVSARVHARGAGTILFGRIPRVVVGCRWMAHDYRTESRPRWETAFPAQAHDEAWRAERAVREWADEPFSVSGQFRVVNSNIS